MYEPICCFYGSLSTYKIQNIQSHSHVNSLDNAHIIFTYFGHAWACHLNMHIIYFRYIYINNIKYMYHIYMYIYIYIHVYMIHIFNIIYIYISKIYNMHI